MIYYDKLIIKDIKNMDKTMKDFENKKDVKNLRVFLFSKKSKELFECVKQADFYENYQDGDYMILGFYLKYNSFKEITKEFVEYFMEMDISVFDIRKFLENEIATKE
ncbi:MAG: hypothetical protein ACK5LV_08695 [Lachnospirales bacterium]